MASVYYLFDDAVHVADDIVQKYSQQDRNLKDHHLAAILIQRAYRGYVVRKNLNIMHRAATTLQKYIRGWLVRFTLPERLQEEYDKRCLKLYQTMATKLQSCWKGVLVRREINIKRIMEDKRKAEEQMLSFAGDLSCDNEEEKTIKNIHQEEEEEMPDAGVGPGNEKFFKERILEMLFDRHHLLSTKVQKGVLKNHSELIEIEKVLAFLPWTNYMKKLRNIYYKYKKEMCPIHSYMFANKQLRKQEDLLRLRDKRNDKKGVSMIDCVADNRTPFILNTKPPKHSYERYLLLEGKYFVPQRNVARTQDRSQNICDRDFELTLKKVVKQSDVPPYYADFWYQECSAHNFID